MIDITKKGGSITEAVGSQLKLGSNCIVQISMPNAQRIQLSSMMTSRLIHGNTKRKTQTMQNKKNITVTYLGMEIN